MVVNPSPLHSLIKHDILFLYSLNMTGMLTLYPLNCYRNYLKIYIYCLFIPDLAPQAHYHADIAKNIMLSGLHTSDSSSSKAELLLMLVKMYYVLGRAFTIMKKYPFVVSHVGIKKCKIIRLQTYLYFYHVVIQMKWRHTKYEK